MSTPGTSPETRLEIRRTFAAPREKVFAAWTQREELEKWMCRDVPEHNPRYTRLDLRPGGRYEIKIPVPKEGFTYRGHGTFSEVKPPEKLVFTWAWEQIPPPQKKPEDMEDTESLITVLLIDRGKLTEMIFIHENFTTVKVRDSHKKGWDGCFDELDKALAA